MEQCWKNFEKELEESYTDSEQKAIFAFAKLAYKMGKINNFDSREREHLIGEFQALWSQDLWKALGFTLNINGDDVINYLNLLLLKDGN